MKKLFLTIVCLFLMCSASYAACSWTGNTGTVASPYAAADVNACISDASSLTGAVIIQIPDSTPTWTENVTLNMSTGFANVTGVTIKGQNACTLDANGRPTSCGTVISGTNKGFIVTGIITKAWRISNMTLSGGIGISAQGNNQSWRIDHIYFNAPTGSSIADGRAIWAQGTGGLGTVSWGLIDHCTVYNQQAIFMHVRANLSDCGNYEWSLGNDLGTANAVYIEYNTFTTPEHQFYAAVTDCEGGGFVARHNIFGEVWFEMHDAINGSLRGCRKWEIYDNTFTNIVGSGQFTNMHLRSGMGVAFNNTVTHPTEGGHIMEMNLYRTYQTDGGPWDTLCGTDSGKAYLDTITRYPENCTSGTGCVNKDGAGTGGFPCRDQIGTSGNGTQTIVPALFWNNKVDGSFFEPFNASGGDYYTKGAVSTNGAYCSNGSATKPSLSDCQNYVAYTPLGAHPLNTDGASVVTGNQSFGSTAASGSGRKMGSTTGSGSGVTVQ